MKVRGLRWWLLTLIFLAAVLNYVDRQTLSLLAPKIQHDLNVDDREYANVVNIFLIAYTAIFLVSGKIVDVLGTRTSMMIFVAWWSVSNMLTSAAQGVQSLGVYRFLLGMGEAGVWPAASKGVSEWFPPRERAVAIGLYTMGATIGATAASYIIIPLASYPFAEKLPFIQNWLGAGAGWRIAFIVTGTLGLLWLVPWRTLYGLPRQSKLIRPEELRLIEETVAGEERVSEGSGKAWTWAQIFAFKGTWLLLVGRLLTDPVWYFYQFWFPKYLNAERGLSQAQLTVTWVIYAAAGVGSVLGGWLSGRLVKRGTKPAASRLWIMLGCACLLPVSPFIARAAGTNAALALTVIAVLATLAWLINITALVVDVVPQHSVGTVFGVVAAGSTLGGLIMNTVVAVMVSGPSLKPPGFLDQAVRTLFSGMLEQVEGKGYGQWFLLMAFLHPIAWLILWLGGVHRTAQRQPALAPQPA